MSKKEKNHVRPSPIQGHCHFWLDKKKRYCRLIPKPGLDHCAEHSVDRIPCPYDPKHTVEKSYLKKHLIRCNSRPIQNAYFCENINLGQPTIHPFVQNGTPLTAREYIRALPKDEFQCLIQKIQDLYQLLVSEPFQTQILTHSVLDQKISQVERKKHYIQQSSLLGHLEQGQLLKSDHVFLEFGAGRGAFATHVHEALEKPAAFILVDRSNFKNKDDRMVDKEETEWHRLKVDIKDLNLATYLPSIGHATRPLVAMSKHLCGVATDLTLNCLNLVTNQMKGIMIALCCHHVCQFGSYCNPDFLKKNGIDEALFACLSTLSSWATCGRANDHDITEHWTGMTFEERETLGYQCKRIIDIGRVEWLQSLGYTVELVYYCTRDISLENMCLMATR